MSSSSSVVRLDEVHKSIIYQTSTKDIVDAQNMFQSYCEDTYCEAGYFCDKIHSNNASQKFSNEILQIILAWDLLPSERESTLCLRPCQFHLNGICNKGTACTFLHKDDIMQTIALDMRYNYNCSFKWSFVERKPEQ